MNSASEKATVRTVLHIFVAISAITIVSLLGLYLSSLFDADSFFHKPDKTIVLELDHAPPITRGFIDWGMNVYYRGFKVGKISDIRLASDQKSIRLYADIYYKALSLPKNSRVRIGLESLTGRYYVEFVYPKSPSEELLSNYSVVKVDKYNVFDEIMALFEEEFSKKRFRNIFHNVEELTTDASTFLHSNNSNLNTLLQQAPVTARDLSAVSRGATVLVSDPSLRRDIKSTLNYSTITLKNVAPIVSDPDNRKDVEGLLKRAGSSLNSVERMDRNVDDMTNRQLPHTTALVEDMQVTVNDVNAKIPATMPKTMNKIDCVADKASRIASKRFVVFRFLFGNPGKPLEDCVDCLKCPDSK